jgi:hypothetical protein
MLIRLKMLASPHWNSFIVVVSLCSFLLASGSAQAQYTTRKEMLPPPSVEGEAPAADQVVAEQAQPAYAQPFPTSPALPENYKPSRSAIDPVESETTIPDPYNPASSPLPPTYEGDGQAKPKVTMDAVEAGPMPPDIIRATPDPRIYTSVTLQGLDKVTARRQQIQANLGTVTSFGNLEIVPRACWQSPPDEQPDAAALLEIWQWKPGEKPSFVFYGWMFASSPGLSSLEHPIYDLAVLECVQDPKEAKKFKKKLEQEAKAEAEAAKAKAKKEAQEAAKRAAAQEAEKALMPAPQEEAQDPMLTTRDPEEVESELERAPLLHEENLDINAPQPD